MYANLYFYFYFYFYSWLNYFKLKLAYNCVIFLKEMIELKEKV